MPYPVLPPRTYGFQPLMTEADKMGPPIELDFTKTATLVTETFVPTMEQANTAANRIEAFLEGQPQGYDLSDGEPEEVLFFRIKSWAGLGFDDVQCKLSIRAGWEQLLAKKRIQCVDGRAAVTIKPSRRRQIFGRRSGKTNQYPRGARNYSPRVA